MRFKREPGALVLGKTASEMFSDDLVRPGTKILISFSVSCVDNRLGISASARCSLGPPGSSRREFRFGLLSLDEDDSSDYHV